jgi:magnesium-transporting ATPase (P-type)
MDFANFYFEVIRVERHWSWALIGIFYLVLAIGTRLLIFRKIVQDTKKIDLQLYSSVTKLYLKNSTAGWILFFISFLLVVAFWMGWKGFLTDRSSLVIFCALLPLLFFLSMVLHLIAFAQALLAVLRQKMGVEREF